MQLRERVLQVITASVGERAAHRLLIESYPEVEVTETGPNRGRPAESQEHEMSLAEDDGNSLELEPSIEPHLCKSPPEQMYGMEKRMDRLDEFAATIELVLSKVGQMDIKLDRFSVSLTEVSTEVSDLRSSSSLSPNNKRLIGNQLRSELKDTFTEAIREVQSEQSGSHTAALIR
jgi:hypothetical protein